MEDVYKKLEEATGAVMNAQGNDEESSLLVLSTAEEDRVYEAYHGTGYAMIALLAKALMDDEHLLNIVRIAVRFTEDEKKKCDA